MPHDTARELRKTDAEVIHLMTLGTAPYAQPRFAGRLRHNALFIGPDGNSIIARFRFMDAIVRE